MAFVVEDGTGKADANAYVLVAYADAYFLERNIPAWAGTNEVKQSAIIQATDYVELRYSNRFIGDRSTDTQALSFPRVNTGFPAMPTPLLRAVCEYAVRSLTATLLPDPVVHESGQGLERNREKVGPIETEQRFQYQGPGTQRIILRPYPAADYLLKDLIIGSAGRVIRG